MKVARHKRGWLVRPGLFIKLISDIEHKPSFYAGLVTATVSLTRIERASDGPWPSGLSFSLQGYNKL